MFRYHSPVPVIVLFFAFGCGDASDPTTALQASGEQVVTDVGGDVEFRIGCTEAALRQALELAAAAGGGTVRFDCWGSSIDIADQIELRASNVSLDGEDRNLTFRYTGPDPCSQDEGLDAFLEIYGDNNAIRNFTIQGFPEGIHFQAGDGNTADNVRFPIVCEDAISNSGSGYVATNSLIRDSYFQGATDKAIQINTGGSITVRNSEFVNCQQPVRAGGSRGRIIVRDNVFRGASTGARFNGGSSGMYVTFQGNTVRDATYGIRIYGDVEAVIADNTFQRGTRTGNASAVYAFDRGRVRLERNAITGYDNRHDSHGILLQGAAQADLGGGSVEIDGSGVSSAGRNTIRNGRAGVVGVAAFDVMNQTQNPISAQQNWWDYGSVAEVRTHDVSGPVDVDPLQSGRSPADLSSPSPT